MSAQAAATAVFRMREVGAATSDCEPLACEFVGVVTAPRAVVGIAFIGVAALVALAYVRTATEACRSERRRVLNEREAFEEFADRVADLDPVPAESSAVAAGGSPTGLHQTVGSGNAADVTLRQVVSIYKETVMSASHYGAEYDETVPESMAAELGPDTTTSLATNGTLFAPAQRALADRAHEAAAARTRLADAIESELDALSDAETELTAIDRRRRQSTQHLAEVDIDEAGAAIDVWYRLADLEAEAEDLAAERQRRVHEPSIRADHALWDTDEMAFYEYLYHDADVPRHPLLSEITDLIAAIREDRDRTARRIADAR